MSLLEMEQMSEISMSKRKRHHYVSQSYLRNFARDERIYVFDKVKMQYKFVGIKDVAVQEHFHKFPTEDIPINMHPYLREQFEWIARYSVEEQLMKLEGSYARLLHKLIRTLDAASNKHLWLPHDVLGEDDMAVLAHFVAVSFLRTLEYRTRMKDFYRKVWKALKSNEQTAEHITTDQPFPDKLTSLLHVQNIFTPNMDTFVSLLLDRLWIVGVNTSKHPLYTSDNPVVRNPGCIAGHVPSGLADDGMEVAFPLSPKYLLLIKDREFYPHQTYLHGKTLPLTIEEVATYSRLQVLQSYRQVYASSEHFGLAELVCRADRPEVCNPNRDRYRITLTTSNNGIVIGSAENIWDDIRDVAKGLKPTLKKIS